MEKDMISLGMNCEVSFQIARYVEKVNSSLFSWAFISDEDLFIDALYNLDDIFVDQISFVGRTDDMFQCDKYKIAFHGRTSKSQFLDAEGNIINQDIYDAALAELKSRLEYLKAKFRKQLAQNKELLFFKKIDAIDDYEKIKGIIDAIYQYLLKNCTAPQFKLIIVLEEKYNSRILEQLETENLAIRYVSYFAPTDDTKDGADNAGWDKIIREFYFDEKSIEDMMELLQKRNNEIEEIYARKEYLEKQLLGEKRENEKLRELLQQKDQWIMELQNGKAWLEEQYLNLIKNQT